MENVSVTVSAKSGDVSLSPMLMQFWQPMWSELSVNKVGEKGKDLTLEGRFEAINFALQSIQYLGDENFYGDDTIRVSTMNKNGKNDLDVPIYVEPINDPPFIDIPESIFVEGKITEKGFRIFDKKRDNFNFSIGDPDLIFPGNESHISVMFSVELNSGYLSTNLPAELVNTTELKLKNSYEWQPLRTFVTISMHFMVKAKGLRFRGTINDCNDVMQHLSYHGGKHGDVLTVTVNDMGTYGCYPDCKEMMTTPLLTEATVTLIRRRPMSSLLAHSLGSAIVIEFVVVFSLGVVLLYFMCKCAFLLAREKRNRDSQAHGIELNRVQSSSKQTSTTGLSDSITPITRCHSSPLLTHRPLDFRRRLRCQSERGESSIDSRSNTPFSYDQNNPESPLRGLMPGGANV